VNIPFLNDIFDGNLCPISLISIFCFLVFNHDFITYIDFTHIAASNTASDDITNYVTHNIIQTYFIVMLIYSQNWRII